MVAPCESPDTGPGPAVPFFKFRCSQKTKIESYFPGDANSSRSDRMSSGDGQKRDDDSQVREVSARSGCTISYSIPAFPLVNSRTSCGKPRNESIALANSRSLAT